MRINRNTVLVGRKVVLVPYRKQHVPRYHEWMKDPLIQEQTASQPLTLAEEYEMQQSWAVDEDKLTFIILARPAADEHRVFATTETATARDLVSQCTMVGDVNIFFNARHDEDDEIDDEQAEPVQRSTRLKLDAQQTSVFDAECEIMIAEHGHRRKGIAREALQMMVAFVTTNPTPTANAPGMDSVADRHANKSLSAHCSLPIPLDWLTCKISLKNAPSIQLFESLGFTRQSVSEIWQEVEMRFTTKSTNHLDQFHTIHHVLYWPDEE